MAASCTDWLLVLLRNLVPIGPATCQQPGTPAPDFYERPAEDPADGVFVSGKYGSATLFGALAIQL